MKSSIPELGRFECEENQILLIVDCLKVYYRTARGPLKAVDGVSFSVQKGEILGLVGESGCGKTTVALATLKLLPSSAQILGGKVLLDDDDLLTKTEQQMKEVRWKKISIIFQAALNALDPLLPVKDQISEAISAHEQLSDREIDDRIDELFAAVGLDKSRKRDFPHEFSGGMKQRIMIAMALACNPDYVIGRRTYHRS
jgi:peptide/nickel transport system ATP-binding protein